MQPLNHRIPVILIGTCMCASAALAQTPMPAPVGQFVDFSLDSGVQDNPAAQAEVLFEGTVHVDNAAWIRLYFTDTVINSGMVAGQSGFIRITSALDGEVQELNDSDLRMWNDTSAYFNGDTLYVELIGAPGSTGNRVGIAYVAAEYPTGGPTAGTCGICDNDDRVPSAELWTARTVPVGCTASVWNEESCMVTAGHCSDGAGDQVAQFRVPASNSNCTINNPPIAEQFPITGRMFQNGGVGADWSVLTTGTNNLGEKPFERYGVLRPIAAAPANVNDVASITGYGVDTQCTRTQTQQFHEGRITQVLGTHYRYLIDMTFGNSGSDVIVNGECVAINTHCQNIQCPQNFGTRVDLPAFANARARLCPAGGAEGACCLPDGTCVQSTRQACAERGGRYQGDNTDCRNVNCGPDCCDNVKWDNDIVPNGVNARAVSPPGFPDIRVVDDFLIDQNCRIECVQANLIEDAGWTPGNNVAVTVRRHDAGTNGPVPGAAGIVTSVVSSFTRTATGDQYFGRDDFNYCVQLGNNAFNLAAGHYWVGIRNPGGGGAGTNYWMVSDGGQAGTSTGWFSLDAGANFQPEGDPWEHAFEIGGTPIGGEGACCLPDGTCVQITRTVCEERRGRYQGDNTDCRNVDCTPVGACCLPNGECIESTRQDCADQRGSYQGDNTSCREVDCTPVGACCLPDGACVQSTRQECADRQGRYQGDNTDCRNVDCTPEGACCLPDGTCVQSTRQECADRQGRYQGDNTDCRNVDCALEGACCLPDGTCVQTTRTVCEERQGRYQGDNTDCREVDCAPRGACCNDGECEITRREDCLPCEKCDTCDGDIDCDGQVNPVDAGLCQSLFGSRRPRDLCICDIDCDGQINPVDAGLIQSLFGTCSPPTPACPGFGDYQGDGTDCDPNPCGQENGACCISGDGGCDWDNGLVPNGVNGRALSPPGFPDIRVADDFRAATGCKIVSVHANVIEDDGWTDGGEITVEVRADSGGSPGGIVGIHVGGFTRTATGDSYFGRVDYDYWVEGMSIDLGAGTYWVTIRNHLGGGAGTNYWMTSDGGADGPGSSTGWFSLDGGGTFQPEGDGWHHAFEIVSAGGGGRCVNTNDGVECERLGGRFLPGEDCADDPCGACDNCDDGLVDVCGGDDRCHDCETPDGSCGCVTGAACDDNFACPNGQSDCPAGMFCCTNTCCDFPICLTPCGAGPEPVPGDESLGWSGGPVR